MDSNTAGTAGVHVGNITTSEEYTALSGGASIGAHVSEATGQSSCPTHSVEEILGVHLIGDNLWGGIN